MSVTIQTTFADVVALQKPLVVSASSNKTADIGTTVFKFRYVLELTVNGTLVITVKQQPNAGQYAQFDLYRILKTYLDGKYLESTTQIHKILTACDGDDTAKYVQINISEEYATSETTDPSNQGGDATASFMVINSVFQFFDGVTPTLAEVYEYNDNNTPISWLTKMPTTQTTRQGEYQTAAILASAFRGSTYPVSTSLRVKYTFYEADGTQISTANVTRTTIGMSTFVNGKSTANANKMYQFIPVGYQNLEEQSFNVSIRPSAQANLAYYTVQVFDATTDPNGYITKEYRFNIADCTKYTPIQITWLNELGAWDYYTFDLASIQALKIQRDTIRKMYGNWSAGANFDYDFHEGGERVIKIEADKEYTVNSDWLNDEDFEWLQSLFMSTDVFTLNSNGDYVPIVLLDSDYQIKQSVNEKLNSLTLKFKLSHKIR